MVCCAKVVEKERVDADNERLRKAVDSDNVEVMVVLEWRPAIEGKFTERVLCIMRSRGSGKNLGPADRLWRGSVHWRRSLAREFRSEAYLGGDIIIYVCHSYLFKLPSAFV